MNSANRRKWLKSRKHCARAQSTSTFSYETTCQNQQIIARAVIIHFFLKTLGLRRGAGQSQQQEQQQQQKQQKQHEQQKQHRQQKLHQQRHSAAAPCSAPATRLESANRTLQHLEAAPCSGTLAAAKQPSSKMHAALWQQHLAAAPCGGTLQRYQQPSSKTQSTRPLGGMRWLLQSPFPHNCVPWTCYSQWYVDTPCGIRSCTDVCSLRVTSSHHGSLSTT